MKIFLHLLYGCKITQKKRITQLSDGMLLFIIEKTRCVCLICLSLPLIQADLYQRKGNNMIPCWRPIYSNKAISIRHLSYIFQAKKQHS